MEEKDQKMIQQLWVLLFNIWQLMVELLFLLLKMEKREKKKQMAASNMGF